MISRRAVIGILALAAPVMSVTAVHAGESVVNASLWDKGAGSLDGKDSMAPMGMGMEGVGMMADMATMGIDIDVASVAAGAVTFQVTNASATDIHEMLVAPIVDETTQLPYSADEDRVDEEAAHDMGEVSELEPGQSGSLTINMKPGKYILFCNIPGHYVMGMWAILEVTG